MHGVHTCEVVSSLLPRLHARQHVALGASKGCELRALQLQQILGVGFWREGCRVQEHVILAVVVA